jgi:hypothetical protein
MVFSCADCIQYCTAFRDRRDCRDNADKRSRVSYVYDWKRKGKNKYQRSRDLIDNGMNRCQRVLADESDRDIDKLDQCYYAYPYDDPHRKFKDRQELYQCDRGKNHIGKGVKLCAELG